MTQTLTRDSLPKSTTTLVDSLPPEMKGEVLCELLRQLIRYQGETGVIPVTTDKGEFLAIIVPAAVERQRYEALLSELTPDARARMTRPLPPDFDPNAVLTDEQLEANRTAA